MHDPIEISLTDGDWTCRWISELYYKRIETPDKQNEALDGISVNSRVSYEGDAGPLLTINASVYNLFMTITGSRLRVKNGIVQQFYPNAQQEPARQDYTIQVAGKALTAASRRLYRHLGLDGAAYSQITDNKRFMRDVIRPLRLPDKFAYSYAHCIPNAGPAHPDFIDYFLVPSFEVLRYFFLHGSMLDEYLLSYFTGQGERNTQSLGELFTHPTGRPQLVPEGARKLAPLFIREGLSEDEVNCIGRIGFIPQAYNCLELVKESLLVNSLGDKGYAYGKLKTIFPQNEPFKMGVCGQRFRWQNKNYLLVDQIYDTEEIMPFDQVIYMPLVDHRSQALIPGQAKEVQSPRTIPRTSPDPPSLRTDTKAGNTDQPAHLTNFLLTKSFFAKSLEPPHKLKKEGQTTRYLTPALAHIAQQLVSLLDQAQAQADAGRGKGHRKDLARYAAGDRQPTDLFKALGQIKGYKCSYFDLDRESPAFGYRFHLNHQRSLSRPFDIVLCRLEPGDGTSRGSIYLVWANTIRYALFYAPALRQFSWADLTHLCNNCFGQAGVYAFGKDGKFGLLAKQMKAYNRRNQLNRDAAELAEKIGDELDDIFDDHAPRLR